MFQQPLRHLRHAERLRLMRPADAGDSLVGMNLQQIQTAVRVGVHAVANRLAALPAVLMKLHIGDFHPFSLRA